MAFLVVFGTDAGAPEGATGFGLDGGALPLAPCRVGAPLVAGHVHVAPSEPLAIVAGRFARLPGSAAVARRNPIDSLFGALALDQTENAAAVLLAGGGEDGVFGLRAIKENGGITFVEAPDERGATLEGALPVEAIPARLADYFARRSCLARTHAIADLAEIRGLLAAETSVTFADYADDALARRVARRMRLLGLDRGAAYLDRLRSTREERRVLAQDILISVSNFFREPRAFAKLRCEVIPRLFEDRTPGAPITIWVAGCAGGEEVYSLAMLLAEENEREKRPREIRILATDLKEEALAIARAARYSAAIGRDVSARRLARHFVWTNGAYELGESLRRMCHFARHDILQPPPYGDVDLISCRNLLVYFRPAVQDRILARFHDALRPGGYLFLGAPDAPPRDPDLFRIVSDAHRIFCRPGPPGTTDLRSRSIRG